MRDLSHSPEAPVTAAGRAFLREPFRIEGLSRPIADYIRDIEAEARGEARHRLLLPPHPGGVYLASALCSCGEWQWDADSEGRLFGQYQAVLRDFTAHVVAA